MKIKRRRFLVIAGGGTLIAALASAKFFATSFEDSTEKLIKRELHFLKLDDDGVAAFVSQYARTKDRNYKLILKSYGLLGIDSTRSGKVHQLVSTYLLSTDFFANDMDESRVIKFVALYDPYLRPCVHPFANPDTTASPHEVL